MISLSTNTGRPISVNFNKKDSVNKDTNLSTGQLSKIQLSLHQSYVKLLEQKYLNKILKPNFEIPTTR
jgi:hypothetical protein